MFKAVEFRDGCMENWAFHVLLQDGGVNEAGNALCQGFNCLCGRKEMASVCAGSRVWRSPSSFWMIPCAGSCRDCVKAVRSDSLSGRIRTLWGLLIA
eukprot:198298-Pelagomonas_calceolata.AAC.1